MTLGTIARKYQVWLTAGGAAAAVALTMMLSAPATTRAAQDLGGEPASAQSASLATLGLPVGALAILVLLIGSRALRRVRRLDETPGMPTRFHQA